MGSIKTSEQGRERGEATAWEPGKSGNPKGKTPGTLNRSTIARQILQMAAIYPDKVFEQLKKQYPEISQRMTVEEVGTIIQADKMIRERDTAAYRAIMDSAYGAPKQEIDQTITGQIGIHITDKDAKLGA